MHLIATTTATIDDLIEPVDLAQAPGDMVVVSFTDSDLAALAAAWRRGGERLPSLRLAHLRDLRHPLSVDLWLDKVAAHARVIVVRLLGGLDWWRYGTERLAELARARNIALAVLPGEDRDDPGLVALSTLPAAEAEALLGYFRAGGGGNMDALLRRLARHAGADLAAEAPAPVPASAFYLPGEGLVAAETMTARLPPRAARVAVVFYRSLYLADDLAPVDALCAALVQAGAEAGVPLAPVPVMVASLKDPACAAFVRGAVAELDPAVIVTTTAFALGADDDGADPFAGSDAPLLQAIVATTRREAWQASPRGLAAADLAMHVVLPELDGRVLAGALSFKDAVAPNGELFFTGFTNRAEPDRALAVARRAAALVGLARTPAAQRRVAVVLPEYPGAAGRAGYAVGLDVPQSVLALLDDLADAGYTIAGRPADARALLDRLDEDASSCPEPAAALSLSDYRRWFAGLPGAAAAAVTAAWGDPAADPALVAGAFHFRVAAFGQVLAALPPERGAAADRRADYHDPALPPRHALLAFGCWLRRHADAVVHMGAHGTFEWLPGKAVALDAASFPELLLGPLPVIYPFIVSNPGEAAQAKRRIAAVTLGHLPAPTVAAGLDGPLGELEQLVDEYAQADGLDRRRRGRLARLIVEVAERAGLGPGAGRDGAEAEDEALTRIDAQLCDLKDMAVKDGLHVYGRGACGQEERDGLLAALAGRRVAPGPAGAPARGRTDVVPTGRNLFTADPRTLPTATASELARLAAGEVLRQYRQAHGDWPRSLVIDLWGSATLRTGGEEIAQGLALMGCRATRDPATGRVSGVEVLPPAVLGRPRVDVTWRISGLFRDLFPAQLALIDAATRAVAAREGEGADNPLAETAVAGGTARIFGTAPGAYGAGIEALLASGRWASRDELGRAYLAAGSHAYGGADSAGHAAPAAFAARVAGADALVHGADDPGRDLLEGTADAGFVGGFAAAAASLGAAPAVFVLDTSKPETPQARPLAGALARIVRGRALSPRFIDGQRRHGPRGAAELAETVDRLIDFAATTDAVPSDLIDRLFDAYVADDAVRAFLLDQNPQAAAAIAARLAEARRRGLWHPRRNDVDRWLAAAEGRPEAAE
ncbi:cobaltochelatase subunit CobN [Chelatococcus reniformis]|uniref:Cobaltochelatase subunit CobN n=1 Tax=Chelatococcus reniformis TaxID=1494448 RepID=A0A916XN22_9HYPH|nr:cobaltochelatase subunit CobN [Chelatococcus reniformis]GGC85988.1 cobaltochelatase subunit CobN [Chelatococcus reniformis]